MGDINHYDSSIFAAAVFSGVGFFRCWICSGKTIRLVRLARAARPNLLFAAGKIFAQLLSRPLTPPVRLRDQLRSRALPRLAGYQTALRDQLITTFRLIRTHVLPIAEIPGLQKTDTIFPAIFHRT
ncbi:hypothetical protein FHT86_005955 [Rhizobium sp. BK313]|nr:hypothetical protein [Rhizobium sp. BK313]